MEKAELPDWAQIEKELFQRTYDAIMRYSEHYPDEECNFLAYAFRSDHGIFSLGLDTPQNSVSQAKENQNRAIERRIKMLTHDWSWESASSYFARPKVHFYTPQVHLFKYYPYENINFDWTHPMYIDNYPQGQLESSDDYLEGNCQIVLWKVFEQIIADGVLHKLKMTSPFRIGYQLYGETDIVVLRILNW